MSPVLIWLELCGISFVEDPWCSPTRIKQLSKIENLNNSKKATVAGLVRRLKCSADAIRRVAGAFYEGGDIACAKLHWGKG